MIDQLQNAIKDFRRKQTDYRRVSGEQLRAFEKECADLRIDVSPVLCLSVLQPSCEIEVGLKGLVEELPALWAQVSALADDPMLHAAIDFYTAFTEYVAKKGDGSLEMLQYVQINGNTPLDGGKVHVPKEEEAVSAPLELDWGDDAAPTEDEIDWGAVTFEGITVEAEGQAEVEVKAMEAGGGVLDNGTTRNQFINDLLELKAFLSQRLCEMGAAETSVSVNQFLKAPAILQQQTEKSVEQMLERVGAVLECISGPRARLLVLLHTSPRFVERTVGHLVQLRETSKRMAKAAEDLDHKVEEVTREIAGIGPSMARDVALAGRLKKDLEESLSAAYEGRSVVIDLPPDLASLWG